MQFICPQDGFPFILLANASDEANGMGKAEAKAARATAETAGIIHFIETSLKNLMMREIARHCHFKSCGSPAIFL
jgi:hypothetical protein